MDAGLWLKRDDLTDLALGGDKPRKLEYELGKALAEGADIVVTTGSSQSNFARLLTAAARHLGLEAALVLAEGHHPTFQGNLLLVRLLGARVRLVREDDIWNLDQGARELCDELRAEGRRPYLIPVSGTTPLACLGYVRAGIELAAQLQEGGVAPAAIYCPFGTGGIVAGLLVGLNAAGLQPTVVGVSVNRERGALTGLLEGWLAGLGELLAGDFRGLADRAELRDDQLGSGYGAPTEAGLDAIATFARTEGILLDPVYSGKTAAALLQDLAGGRWAPGEQLVMLHSGGVPALFAYHEELQAHLAARGWLA